MSPAALPVPGAGYPTLVRDGRVTAEIEVKRSRFLAVLQGVDDEAAARSLVTQLRREHHDARHHCSAFVLGVSPRIERSSDDGEPAGTAGAPMLEVLRGSGLSDVVAVVVRWFGGTLLGAGGLVRAYGDAVSAALERADGDGLLVVREPLTCLLVIRDHASAGRFESEVRSRGIVVADVEYGTDVRFTLAHPDAEELTELVAALSAGAARASALPVRWVDVPLPPDGLWLPSEPGEGRMG